MSQGYNPYGGSPGNFGGGGWSPSPPPRKGGSGAATGVGVGVGVIALIVGGGVVVVLACCGLCCGLAQFGANQTSQEVAVQIRDQPAVVQHVGELQTCTYNWAESGTYSDFDVEVYDLVGTAGTAQMVASVQTTFDGEPSQVIWAKLILPDGSEQVILGQPPEFLERN